jgi:hypothetical protein
VSNFEKHVEVPEYLLCELGPLLQIQIPKLRLQLFHYRQVVTNKDVIPLRIFHEFIG